MAQNIVRPVITQFEHRCVVQLGDMAGSKWCVSVDPFDVEYGTPCQECGEPLA